jgi:SAM-dependent methyltransferase
MDNQLVFQDQTEIERLAVQNRLLSLYETPFMEQLFSGCSQWAVLDIGCNDGGKTVRRFDHPGISKVLGLEYNEKLARLAQERYGNEKFSFYSCDVEQADFPLQLERLCHETGIQTFDVIYLSFVLMHLSSPELLLERLKPFLKDTGYLLIIEPNDQVSQLEPDPQKLLPKFLDILKEDPYAGNRQVGEQLPGLVQTVGYGDITLWNNGISAEAGEPEKKQDIFQTFFSYLPEDVQLLRRAEPNNCRYAAWQNWLQAHYKTLEREILQENSRIFMGLQMLSCRKAAKDGTVFPEQSH